MMTKIQEAVHTYEDEFGEAHCYERKIVSGDNKTEKNMHYGILRYVKWIYNLEFNRIQIFPSPTTYLPL